MSTMIHAAVLAGPVLPRCAAAPDAIDFTSNPTLRDRLDALRAIQQRLGTKAEATNDFAQVCLLAHEINNYRMAEHLRLVVHAHSNSTPACAPEAPQRRVA